MTERLERARRLGERVDAGWQREDVEAQLARLHGRQRTRARRRVLALPLVALAAGVVGVWLMRAPAVPEVAAVHPVAPVAPPAPVREVVPAPEPPPPVSGVLSLGDGSVVTPLAKTSQLLARRVSETEVVVTLAGGGASFEIPDRATRRFRAELGALALETHGAAFHVGITRREIQVVAERGEVSARWGRERRVVAAGETRTFPLAARDLAIEATRVEHDAPIAASTWRDDAGRGDYAAAWRVLATVAPLERMEDLLLAGDVARLSGHAGAAVAQLARAVALHPEDPRAPLAAFTLGRVHLEDLGAPRDAARAFAQAREIAPAGPLAEDALAREVEAWSRAGEAEPARARALTYAERYPHGRRAHAVRKFGGLEAP
jgi:transmembrane sensor